MDAIEVTDADSADCLASSFPILFHSMRSPAPSVSNLYLSSADGGDVREITRNGNVYGSTWSPDGRSIAYRRMEVSDFREDVDAEVALFAPDQTVGVSLFQDLTPSLSNTLDTFPSDGPTWSADGRELAFASRRSSGAWAVWIMSRSGGPPRLVMPDLSESHFAPSFDPIDVRRLAFVAEGAIWFVDVLDPGARTRITSPAEQANFLEPTFLRWSPDGTRIAFSALDPADLARGEADREIYVLYNETRSATKLTDDDFDDVTPTWAPDGSSLLIGSNRSGSADSPGGQAFQLWQLPLDPTSPARPLTVGPSSNAGADWYERSDCGDRS
jgi:Tol biopolymer transport system component